MTGSLFWHSSASFEGDWRGSRGESVSWGKSLCSHHRSSEEPNPSFLLARDMPR